MSVIKKVKKHFKDAKDKKNKYEQEQLNRPPKELYKKLFESDTPGDRAEFNRLQKKYNRYLGHEPKEKNRIGKKKTSMDSKDYKAGGYVLSAEDKKRRKAFKSSKATKNNTRGHKNSLREGGMVIVDRNYLKGR